MTDGAAPRRLLLTGADGFVARALRAAATAAALPLTALSRTDLDITDADAVRARLAGHAPDVVVNGAAFNDNDRAEVEPDRAFAVNRDGPAILAEACAASGAWLVHLSTDSVFGDVETAEGHREDAAPAPVSVYARSKLAGEDEVRRRCPRHVVLRLTWQFGPGDRAFVGAITRRALVQAEVSVATGQVGCPTPVETTAGALLALVAAIRRGVDCTGTWHFCSRGAVTRMQLAEAVVEELRRIATPRVERLVPVPASALDRARRPRCSVLDCRGFTRLTGVRRPEWRGALAATVRDVALASGAVLVTDAG